MSGFDLLAASIGLAVSALAAALLLPLWRRAPVPAYRLAVSVLAAALALPLLQWAARALELPVRHPARDLALALGAGLDEQPDPALASVPLALALPVFELSADPIAATAAPALQAPAPPAAAPLGALRTWPWTTLLLAAWAAGALWALGHTARRLLATQRLFALARPVADPARLAVWDAVRAGSRTGARTRLCESAEVRTPACAGLLRPAVVLPADDSLAGRPELLACVLTHELVHLERRDPWVLLGEELLRAAFWFHPAAWWLVARLAALRELSCDCLVVRRTGKRKRYASALVEYATWMQDPAPRASWAAVVPWSESRGHLTRRIEMLLQPQTQPKPGRVVAPAAVGVLMTFLWSGQLALATSSCAGTRESHEHEHEHGDAKAHEQAPCASEPCEVQVVTHDGKTIVIETTSKGGDPISAPQAVAVAGSGGYGKPIVYRARAGDGTTVERCLVVLSDSEDEPKVLRGAEAKAWIEENGAKVEKANAKVVEERCLVVLSDSEGEPKVLRGAEAKAWMENGAKVEKANSKLVEEIRGAWLGAEGGEHRVIVLDGQELEHKANLGQVEVIVVGPDGAKRWHGKKAVRQPGQQGEPAHAPQEFRSFKFQQFDDPSAQGWAGGEWTFQGGQPEGQKVDGFYAPFAGKTFELDFGKGHGGAFQKFHDDAHGDVHGDVHGKVHSGAHGQGHAFGGTPPAQGAFGAQGEAAGLDELRRELEATRAALEEQRRMLEELRAQLQKQREKSDTVGAWMK